MVSESGADEAALFESYGNIQHIDPELAKQMLKEAKDIMDRLGVPFFLRQGTCLGAVRDQAFIPWDDDIDLAIEAGEHVADGFVMNFKDESGLNPGINEQNPIVPGSRGGFGLACVSDLAIAGPTAKFGMPESALGVIPAQIGYIILSQSIRCPRKVAGIARVSV